MAVLGPKRMTLAEQITSALAQLRGARAQGELERELFWDSRLDWLLTRWTEGHR
ncbi:hypothetical protein ACAG26_24450 [Mycobacterium sp. pUA109]|uniref:hypothetical protein n=1 Tax=Mycobacterium sp. pUA109 TaxID=3238982 RepID=UPI00351AFBDD